MIPPEIVKALKSSCEMARVYARSIDVAPLQEDIHRQAGIALAYLDTLPAAPAPDDDPGYLGTTNWVGPSGKVWKIDLCNRTP